MKYTVVFLIFLVLNLSANAQLNSPTTKISFSGYVKDSLSDLPLQKVTVYCKNNNQSAPGFSTITDNTGFFIFKNLPAGKYNLSVSGTGYQAFSKNYFVTDSLINNEYTVAIKMFPLTKSLKGVVIIANKSVIENKPDRIIYNVDKDITSQGGVATDILKKIPQVTVDINGNVELLGNPSVRFLINGKPSTVFGNSIADALQSIPASQIQSIEVMSNPGAKYDASGTGGIINIILKKSKLKGFSGIINATTGTRLENGALNLNYKKNNIGITGYYSGSSQLKTATLTSSDRNSFDTSAKHSYYLKQEGNSDFTRFGYRSGLGIDWDIAARDNLSFSFSNFRFGNTSTGFSDQYNTEKDKDGNTLFMENSIRNADNRFDNDTYEAGVDYRRKLKKEKQELSVAYNYSVSHNSSAYYQSRRYVFNDSIFGGSDSKNPGKDYVHTISVDYTTMATKKLLLEVGAKTEIEKLVSNSDVFTFNPAQYKYLYDAKQSYTSAFNRQVIAGYVSGSFKILKSTDIIAGARLEHTFNKAAYSKNQGIKIPDYNNFGPALTVSHTFKNQQTLKFSYAYRLERPEYRDINPFVNLSDPHNIGTGNPYMIPEIGNNFQLGYNQSFGKDNNLNIVLVYTYNSPDIKSYTTFYPAYKVGDSVYTDVNVTMRGNIAAEKRRGVNIAGSFNAIPKLNIRIDMQLYDRTTKNIYSVPIVVSGFEYRGNLNVNYQFNKGLVAEAFGNYNSGLRWQGRRAAFSSYTIALRKQVLKSKGSIGFTAVNAFGKYLSQKSTQIGTGFTGSSVLKIPYRSFGISFMYKFGKMKISKPKEEENYLTKPPVEN
ncbi:outer membrane beta-barrel protein [Ferruginibacter sp. SUN106]|uniref:outer membrane beta-barrel protein n=1 Tax=Ferruginibacter sp. SUN106 TaxID=2978348 RepID=UPI003D359E67